MTAATTAQQSRGDTPRQRKPRPSRDHEEPKPGQRLEESPPAAALSSAAPRSARPAAGDPKEASQAAPCPGEADQAKQPTGAAQGKAATPRGSLGKLPSGPALDMKILPSPARSAAAVKEPSELLTPQHTKAEAPSADEAVHPRRLSEAVLPEAVLSARGAAPMASTMSCAQLPGRRTAARAERKRRALSADPVVKPNVSPRSSLPFFPPSREVSKEQQVFSTPSKAAPESAAFPSSPGVAPAAPAQRGKSPPKAMERVRVRRGSRGSV